MTFFSLTFPAFLAVALLLYYLVPKRIQWWVLLAANLTFYLWANVYSLGYLAAVGLVTYGAGLLLGRINAGQKAMSREERANTAKAVKRKKRLILTACLMLMFGLLFTVKYWNQAADIFERLFGAASGSLTLDILIPMGLSFYIFQTAGYAIDCYRGKYEPEKNVAKYFLFVSFFPQMIQGPISRYQELAPQLTVPHGWSADNIKYGLQRMLWGYLKKMVVADRAGAVVSAVFGDLDRYGGAVTAFAVLFYCIQLYCDFSGGIDISLGAAQLFGIQVAENFKRPIFAVSLSDYWRRWHITLGAWMRDYVFYPLSLSKPFGKLGRAVRKRVRGRAGKVIPTALATFIVYLFIGIWHGANFRYIAYGFWNGILLTASVLLAGTYVSVRERLHIRDDSKCLHIFRLARTMLIVFIGRYITTSPRLLTAVQLLWKTVAAPAFAQLGDGTLLTLGLSLGDYLVVAVGVIVILALEWRQEKGVEIRKALECRPVFVQFLAIFLPLLALLFLGILKDSAIQAAFIYQQF